MKKKSTSRSAFISPRAAAALVLCAVACLIATGTLLAFLPSKAPTTVSQRTLTFAERVAYQYAIEDVYWRHRIWPRERPDAKPSLGAVMTQAQLEKKVTDYLRKSQALEDYWQRPLTADQLQAEMDRMAMHTRQPEILRELFAALGNDPFVIAECLARPALADRLLTSWYAYDQRIHADLKQRAEAELQARPTVEQMKQLSGKYSEIEFIKSDSAQAEENRGAARVRLNTSEWDQTVEKLAVSFGAATNGDTSRTQISTGALSQLQEDEIRYFAILIIEKTNDHLKLATVSWRKEPLDSWLARGEDKTPTETTAIDTSYKLPTIATDGCIDDTWTATTITSAPSGRAFHTAVWTGTEMIVWGGEDIAGLLDTGGRYNASTDSWIATSTFNGPSARTGHTAVWTGIRMIVWGGSGSNTGGRYNPGTDSWTGTSTTNAPTGRSTHTAVWTGSEMIIWGGVDSMGFVLNSGGKYDGSTNSWSPTSTADAPDARTLHTAVWTGGEMIVWGGWDEATTFNTGRRYNASTNSWTPINITNAPEPRYAHTAVWTGGEMIVWGGLDETFVRLNTGGRYNPGTDSWISTATSNAATPRGRHTAVWSGGEMVIWGGYGESGVINTGGRYNPSMDSWTTASTTGAPSGREWHKAVWTGSEMIVWGGTDGLSNYFNTGGRYCAQSAPSPTSTPTATPTATATSTPTPTPSPTASPTPTPTPTPCIGRCSPTPRPRPTPAPRPSP